MFWLMTKKGSSVAFVCLKNILTLEHPLFLLLKYNLNQNFSSVNVLALVMRMIQINSSKILRKLAYLLIPMEEGILKILRSGPLICQKST